MARVTSSRMIRHLGLAAEVSGSQLALAAAGYVVLAVAAHVLPIAAFAALSSFYLLVNTVGRGMFAAVELELTRAVAHARAVGADERALHVAAARRTGGLVALALALVAACAPLLAPLVDADAAVIGLLGAGAVAMAAGYHLRGVLAGRRSYHSYSASYWLEAALVLAAAVGLAVAGVTSLAAWTAVFVLPALISAGVLALSRRAELGATGPAGGGQPTEEPSSTPELAWSVGLVLASQGVWNLAPVIVTARLADDPTAAAGFVAVAIVLRAPVLMFPAVQALLLPRLTAVLRGAKLGVSDAAVRRMKIVLGVAALGWLLAAVFVVPPLTRLVFGVQTLPGQALLVMLAASTAIVAAAQVTQTRLVAARQQHAVATAWIVGLVLMIGVALLPIDPQVAGATAQLTAALVVTAMLAAVWRSWRGRRAGVPG